MDIPVVNQELCIGGEACAERGPDAFVIRDEKSWLIGPEKCANGDCREAAAACPVEAITLVKHT